MNCTSSYGNGFTFILQTRERFQEFRWQQIGAAGKELAQFNERRAEFFEIIRKIMRFPFTFAVTIGWGTRRLIKAKAIAVGRL